MDREHCTLTSISRRHFPLQDVKPRKALWATDHYPEGAAESKLHGRQMSTVGRCERAEREEVESGTEELRPCPVRGVSVLK